MQDESGSRAAMARAVSQYRMVVLRARAHRLGWDKRKAMVLDALNAYEDAKAAALKAVPGFERMAEAEQSMVVGTAVWTQGKAAHEECEAAHGQSEVLKCMAHRALERALEAVGSYHGRLMSDDDQVSFEKRYWQEARRMATTVRALMPWSRIVGPGEDFPTTRGWAKALGMRSARELVAALGTKGHPRLA